MRHLYQNFLLEIKNQREARGCSVDDLSKETKISKKVIYKIENLDESEVDLFPQKHLLFLYAKHLGCLLYTSPSPRDKRQSRMPSSA